MAVVETGSVATVRRDVTIVTFNGCLGCTPALAVILVTMGRIEQVIRFAFVTNAKTQAINGSRSATPEGPPCSNPLVYPITRLSLLVVRT